MEKSDSLHELGRALSLANARLGSAGDLGAWLEAEGALEPEERAEVALRLAEFVTLRASIRELLDASIGGGPFPAGALERVNEASARVPRVVRLAPDGAADTPLSAGPTPCSSPASHGRRSSCWATPIGPVRGVAARAGATSRRRVRTACGARTPAGTAPGSRGTTPGDGVPRNLSP